jgi:2-keto-4-pentenoate hydratase/2-oxohepta-3-ene-1,7-dioic acid hydratase in catechol pathway
MTRGLRLLALAGALAIAADATTAQQAATRYVRYSHQGAVAHGILDGETIRALGGDLFAGAKPTGRTVKRSEATLLLPIDPLRVSKALGVAINYTRPGDAPPKGAHPRWFAKLPSSLAAWDADVELPPESKNLDWEGELVLVIGKKGRHISVADAPSYIFGVTVGNDVSENTWYGERQGREEPSRLVSKSADTWGPIGQHIVTGLDYGNLRIEIKVNGKIQGEGRTSQMIHSPAELVANISRYVTLWPGDLIFTGSVPRVPDAAPALNAGDIVEIEIENVGKIRNRIVPLKVSGTQ